MLGTQQIRAVVCMCVWERDKENETEEIVYFQLKMVQAWFEEQIWRDRRCGKAPRRVNPGSQMRTSRKRGWSLGRKEMWTSGIRVRFWGNIRQVCNGWALRTRGGSVCDPTSRRGRGLQPSEDRTHSALGSHRPLSPSVPSPSSSCPFWPGTWSWAITQDCQLLLLLQALCFESTLLSDTHPTPLTGAHGKETSLLVVPSSCYSEPSVPDASLLFPL